MKKLSFLKPALPLTVISVIIALLLAVINSVTAGRIAENALREKENAIKAIFAECDSFKASDPSLFDNSVNDAGGVFDENGELLGYYADVSPIGFKGEISLIVGTDTEAKIISVELVSAAETPGVGTKATDKSYLSNFSQLEQSEINGVDTITGATISSKAVRQGINSAVNTVKSILKEEK